MEKKKQHIKLLLEQCKENDSKAQFKVYELYYKAMYNTAYRILGEVGEAEDLMQEAFLAAFNQLYAFKGEVSFGAWLKRIVINKSIRQLHKNKKINYLELEKIPEMASHEDDNIIDLKGLDAKCILGKTKQLPLKDQLVFTLFFIEGYDYEEIAQILDVSYANSRVMVSRAKMKYKKLF